ncbi:hypothetical protein JCM24511_02751 [Saitozyma sp. JCM 24511]|nr:hypothetical protein JCM24511_02751 [Saitozyma sp. JCM 24511]
MSIFRACLSFSGAILSLAPPGPNRPIRVVCVAGPGRQGVRGTRYAGQVVVGTVPEALGAGLTATRTRSTDGNG